MKRIVVLNINLLTERRGAVLPLVAILLFVLLGFAAFAVDLGYMHVAKNELQNAADAGSLAGASVLFNPTVNPPDAPQYANVTSTAQATTVSNMSGGKAVPSPTVEVGHYAFASSSGAPGTFTSQPNNTPQLSGWETMSFSALNSNTQFINAVRVTSSRSDVPAFFSRIFGNSLFTVTVQAIAYVGFAGTLPPGTADEPIAICQQAIVDSNGNYNCNVGRMLNSGSNITTHQTSGWTNFSQPCSTASDKDLQGLICSNGNPKAITLGQDMGTTNGVQGNTVTGLYNCWQSYEKGKNPPQPWLLTLPVIDCPGNTLTNCQEVVGAVDLNVIWIVDKNDPQYKEAPTQMGNWICPSACGGPSECCWDGNNSAKPPSWSFVGHFNLQNLDGSPATYQQKTIYFLPDCNPHEPVGGTGGQNFGILAKYPVLVK
jgi:Flp pilus assembly protein TadG